jgi:hypothetical protein
MTRTRGILALVAALFVSVSCSDQPTSAGSGSGTLAIRLTTPHGDDGALTFQVNGPSLESASVNGSLQLFTLRVNDSTLVGAVIGTLTNGAIMTLQVPDGSVAGAYTATLREVADREDALRASLAGYALTVTR